jgi:hypothetical protein
MDQNAWLESPLPERFQGLVVQQRVTGRLAYNDLCNPPTLNVRPQEKDARSVDVAAFRYIRVPRLGSFEDVTHRNLRLHHLSGGGGDA